MAPAVNAMPMHHVYIQRREVCVAATAGTTGDAGLTYTGSAAIPSTLRRAQDAVACSLKLAQSVPRLGGYNGWCFCVS